MQSPDQLIYSVRQHLPSEQGLTIFSVNMPLMVYEYVNTGLFYLQKNAYNQKKTSHSTNQGSISTIDDNND